PGLRRTAGENQAEPRARGQGERLHLREPGSPRPESFLRPIHPEDPAGRNRAAARKAPVALPHRCAGLGEAHRHLLGKKNSVHRQPPVDDRGDHSGVPQSASCGGCLPHHEGSPLRGLGASLSLDRSKNPCPCFLLRAGPDSGWAVAPRSHRAGLELSLGALCRELSSICEIINLYPSTSKKKAGRLRASTTYTELTPTTSRLAEIFRLHDWEAR